MIILKYLPKKYILITTRDPYYIISQKLRLRLTKQDICNDDHWIL